MIFEEKYPALQKVGTVLRTSWKSLMKSAGRRWMVPDGRYIKGDEAHNLKGICVPRLRLCDKSCRGGTEVSVRIICGGEDKEHSLESGAYVAKRRKLREEDKK